MPEARDRDLVAATLAGERGAFDRLVDRYQSKIYNLALRITGSPDDALDATQTAFLKAWDNLGRFDPAHRFFSWIYRIGLNEALRIVEQRRFVAESVEEIAAAAPDPESDLRGKEAARVLLEVLRELPPDHRTVIVLRHFHGLSYEEMGEVVGVTAKTIKSRLFTARRELRQQLKARGVGPGPVERK